MEYRDLPLEHCDLKFANSAKAVTFEGYASVFDRVDSYGDTVKKGAFVETLKNRRKIMMLAGHVTSPQSVVGRWEKMAEDDYGLHVIGELTPGHSAAADIAASLKHGTLNGLSIGGYTRQADEKDDGEGRVIKNFDLFEVSIVALPAEDSARIDASSVKSRLDEVKTISQFERLLRDAANLSRRDATYCVAKLRELLRGELGDIARDDERGAQEFAKAISGAKIPNSILSRV